jgi:hypothetical protein
MGNTRRGFMAAMVAAFTGAAGCGGKTSSTATEELESADTAETPLEEDSEQGPVRPRFGDIEEEIEELENRYGEDEPAGGTELVIYEPEGGEQEFREEEVENEELVPDAGDFDDQALYERVVESESDGDVYIPKAARLKDGVRQDVDERIGEELAEAGIEQRERDLDQIIGMVEELTGEGSRDREMDEERREYVERLESLKNSVKSYAVFSEAWEELKDGSERDYILNNRPAGAEGIFADFDGDGDITVSDVYELAFRMEGCEPFWKEDGSKGRRGLWVAATEQMHPIAMDFSGEGNLTERDVNAFYEFVDSGKDRDKLPNRPTLKVGIYYEPGLRQEADHIDQAFQDVAGVFYGPGTEAESVFLEHESTFDEGFSQVYSAFDPRDDFNYSILVSDVRDKTEDQHESKNEERVVFPDVFAAYNEVNSDKLLVATPESDLAGPTEVGFNGLNKGYLLSHEYAHSEDNRHYEFEFEKVGEYAIGDSMFTGNRGRHIEKLEEARKESKAAILSPFPPK